jgi:hypothetical protein
MNRIEVYEDNTRLNLEEISITNFNTYIESTGYLFLNEDIDFTSFGYLKGDKETLEMAFQHEKKESLNKYGY